MAITEQRALNLLDGSLYARDDLDEVYRRLRDEQPAYWDPVNRVWGISRYGDVVDIEKNTARYTSSHGSRPNIESSQSMINMDDPGHQAQRRLVARQFTPRAVKQLEDSVRAVVTALIDAVAPRGECEVVEDLASRLPAIVIGDKLGFPREMWTKCRWWSEVTMFEGGLYPPDGSSRDFERSPSRSVVMDFAAETMAIVAARRAEPRDDLISVWVHREIELPDGTTRRMSDEDIVQEALLLLDGGAETTRTVIGGMAYHLTQFEEERRRLVADPAILADTGVEEFIRWVTPILNMRRTATEDHELHGQRIAAGDQLVLMYSSANRDERVFERPDVLDVTRRHNHHVAFGFGTHFCLGASLARLEIRVMFEELLRRIPDWRLAPGAQPEIVPNAFTRAYDAVPIEFTPCRA